MKKTLILVAVFLLPLAAFAQAATAPSNAFVPLTSLPITQAINNNGDFSSLVNNLYKICIGAAAVIAVFQIMRAGLMYMSAGDNAEAVGNARKLIGNSILGLVLVLSPFIVFGIINPDILSLKIGNLSVLTTVSTTPTGADTSVCTLNAYQSTTLAAGQTCAVSLQGANWQSAPSQCCAGTLAAGQACCGFTKTTVGAGVAPTTVAPNQYQVPAGTYIYQVGVHTTSNPGCITLLQTFSETTQAACQADKTTFLSGISTQGADQAQMITYDDCVQPPGGSYSIPPAGLCSTQPYVK